MEGLNGSGRKKWLFKTIFVRVKFAPLAPVVCSFLLMLQPVRSSAQLRWRIVDSTYGPLPPSVHVYRSPDSLGGLPFVAYYVSARLKDRKL